MSALSFVMYSLFCSSLLAALASSITAVWRISRVPVRAIWMLSIVMSVSIPLASTLRTPAPTPPAITAPITATSASGAIRAELITEVPMATTDTQSVMLARLEAFDPTLRGVLWASLLVVPLLVAIEWMQLRRKRRSWRKGELNGTAVMVAEDYGPAVVGVIAPEIVIPTFAHQLPAQQQQLLLAHEEEHVTANDGRWSLAMLFVVAIAPWNPVLWWQYARLRLAIELDCDARVLARGKHAHAYGTLLVDMAARSQGVSLVATALVERFTPSLRRRIENIVKSAPRFREIARGRVLVATSLALASVALFFLVPSPAVRARPRTAAQLVADSGAIAVMELNRAGRWAKAEGVGLGFLAKRPPTAESGESCAVLISTTYAQAMQRKRASARASMELFDKQCVGAVYAGFIPTEANRVRRVVNGEDERTVYKRVNTPITTTLGGATAVMVHNRIGQHAQAERIGIAFLSSLERRPGEPEACAVLIGVTFAQAAQQRPTDAAQSLARFDRECNGVSYLDWFPAEAERVRRLVHAERPEEERPRSRAPSVQ